MNIFAELVSYSLEWTIENRYKLPFGGSLLVGLGGVLSGHPVEVHIGIVNLILSGLLIHLDRIEE